MRSLILVLLSVLLFGCSTNLASIVDAATKAQLKLQDYSLEDLDRLIWVEDTCFQVQNTRIQKLISDGEYDKALQALVDMQEIPLPLDFIRQLRKNPDELFDGARWCGQKSDAKPIS